MARDLPPGGLLLVEQRIDSDDSDPLFTTQKPTGNAVLIFYFLVSRILSSHIFSFVGTFLKFIVQNSHQKMSGSIHAADVLSRVAAHDTGYRQSQSQGLAQLSHVADYNTAEETTTL